MNKFSKSLATALVTMPIVAGAQFQVDPRDTTADFDAWFARNQSAEPQFIDGDVITMDKAELARAFVIPAYQDAFFYEGMAAEVKDAGDITPADSYKAATAQYQAQVALASDGAIENYVAGMPFDPATFTPGSEEDGQKLAWNFNFRWQHEGLAINEVHWVWVRKGGEHSGHDIMTGTYSPFYKGGGSFERVLAGPYQRVYFTHRADLADNNYRVEGKWADNTEFREYTGFNAPFDIAGTAFLILRYDDPRKTDDSWAYIPSLRRVRRISVEVKSDSLLGTDHTLEDFYCYSGRPLEWNWKYMGSARVLAVARSRNVDTVYGGPNGWTPVEDDWALRLVDVMQAIPKRANHPYSAKHMLIDRDSGECYFADSYDKAGKLWKVWQLSKSFTDDPWNQAKDTQAFGKTFPVNTPVGARVSAFQSINVIDLQNNRGTLVPCRGNGYPDNDPRRVKRILDVNYLTEGG